MKAFLAFLFCFCFCFCFTIKAENLAILELQPPNTSSPRATMASFINNINKAYKAYVKQNKKDTEIVRVYVDKARRCMDTSKISPSLRETFSIESALALKEVLGISHLKFCSLQIASVLLPLISLVLNKPYQFQMC